MNLKKQKGFTLVELIIVIAILGIIALIAVPSLTNVQANSRVNADYNSAYKIGETIRIWLTDCDRDTYVNRTNEIKNKWVELSKINQGLGDYMSNAKDKPQGLTDSVYMVQWIESSGKIVILVTNNHTADTPPVYSPGKRSDNTTEVKKVTYGIDNDNVIQPGIIYVEGYGELKRNDAITIEALS